MSTLAEPPFRDRFLDDRGFVSQPWRVWLVELVRVIRELL